MTSKEFDQIISSRLKATQALLCSKGKEYAQTDRLSNFKDAAIFTGQSEEAVLWGYVLKHITALKDFIQRTENGNPPTFDQFIEKIGDITAYMLILEAILVENGRKEE